MAKEENVFALFIAIAVLGLVIGFVGTVFEIVSAITQSSGIRVLVTSAVLLVISLGFYRLSEGRFPHLSLK